MGIKVGAFEKRAVSIIASQFLASRFNGRRTRGFDTRAATLHCVDLNSPGPLHTRPRKRSADLASVSFFRGAICSRVRARAYPGWIYFHSGPGQRKSCETYSPSFHTSPFPRDRKKAMLCYLERFAPPMKQLLLCLGSPKEIQNKFVGKKLSTESKWGGQ